jgi:hypothetical protein
MFPFAFILFSTDSFLPWSVWVCRGVFRRGLWSCSCFFHFTHISTSLVHRDGCRRCLGNNLVPFPPTLASHISPSNTFDTPFILSSSRPLLITSISLRASWLEGNLFRQEGYSRDTFLESLSSPSPLSLLFSTLVFCSFPCSLANSESDVSRTVSQRRYIEGNMSKAIRRDRNIEGESSRPDHRSKKKPSRNSFSSTSILPYPPAGLSLHLCPPTLFFFTRNSSRASCLDERVVRQTLVFNISPLFLHRLRSLFFFHSHFVEVESSRRNRRGRRFDERVI